MWCDDIWLHSNKNLAWITLFVLIRNFTNYAKINNQQHCHCHCHCHCSIGQMLRQWHPYNTTISTLILKRNLRDWNIEDRTFWRKSFHSVCVCVCVRTYRQFFMRVRTRYTETKMKWDTKSPFIYEKEAPHTQTRTFFSNVSIYFFNPGLYSSFLSVSKIRARKRNSCGDHSQDERKIIFMLVGWNRMVGVRPLQQLKGTYKLYIDWIHWLSIKSNLYGQWMSSIGLSL